MGGIILLGIEGVLLAFVRFSAFTFSFPLFTQKSVPWQLKIGFSGLLALIINPPSAPTSSDNLIPWAGLIMQEMLIGFLLAFLVSLVFGIIYFTGQLIDVPIGFGMVSIFDPQTGTQLPIFSKFLDLLAMLVFLSIDAHLWIYDALLKSYEMIPIGSFFTQEITYEVVIFLGRAIFSVGLQIALPVMGTILLTDVALGIVTRAVPQINVFVIGFPLKISVGLFMIILLIPVYINIIAKLFGYGGLLFQHFTGMISSVQ